MKRRGLQCTLDIETFHFPQDDTEFLVVAIDNKFQQQSKLLRHGHKVVCDIEKELSAEYATILFRLFQVLGFFSDSVL